MIVDDVKNLFDSELFEDVKLLASCFLSSKALKDDFSVNARYPVTYYQAEAHYQTQEYHSAAKLFQSALQLRFMLKGRKMKNTDLQSESDLRYRQYQCYMKLQMYKEALEALEGIPAKSMTVAIKFALADLTVKNKGNKTMAMQLYKEVIQQNPLSYSAIKAYLSIGGKGKDVLKMIEGRLSPDCEVFDCINTLVEAQCLTEGNKDYMKGAEKLHTKAFTISNPLLMAEAAYFYAVAGQFHKALGIFKLVRDGNSLQYNHLDTYAFLLFHFNHPALETLAMKSSMFPETAVEPWIINGYFNLSFNQPNKACFFAQKALQIESQCFEALLLAGIALNAQTEYSQALVHLRLAIQACPHRIEPYYFISVIYWITGREHEAEGVALDYEQHYPSARAYVLHASILLKDKKYSYQCYSQAQILLRKALELESDNMDVIELLAEVIQKIDGNQEAINFLKEHPPKKEAPRYHKLMANIYLKINGKKVRALDHIIVAKRLEPSLHESPSRPFSFFLDSLEFKEVEEKFLSESNESLPLTE